MADLFSILNDITYSKKAYSKFSESERKEINPFMINRYISFNPDYLELVNFIQFIPYDRRESYYKIYCDFLPKKKLWLKYVKKGKKDVNQEELLNKISFYYQCSKREAKDYLQLLSPEIIKNILKELSLSDKEIKKLIK